MNNNNNNNNNKNTLGGKVIASGGFGCVFSPALKCQGETTRSTNKITKLMSQKHAIEEYEEIMKIKNKLDSIKNYKEYFLINDLTLCKPSKLSQSDLKEFAAKCSALPKDNITQKNINQSLDKVMALNIPDGGLPIDDYIHSKNSLGSLRLLNNKLMDLLENGIIPMNKKNVYHCDIKDSNVLAKENGNELLTRLIDWGLSTEYVPFKDAEFPRTWRNRPFQFNVPFSVIIFSDAFIEKYSKYIHDGGKTDKVSLKPFVLDFIRFWIKERGAGHYKFINDIMFILFSSDLKNIENNKKGNFIESDFTIHYITDYIVAVLEKFTEFRKNGTLNLRKYLDNVFIKIVDVYGFICIYFPLLEILFENYNKLNDNQIKIFNLIKLMFVTYLYSPRTEPIPLNDVLSNLKNLDKLLENESLPNNTAKGIKTKNIKGNFTRKNRLKNKKLKKKINSKLNFKRNRKYLTRRLKKYLMLS